MQILFASTNQGKFSEVKEVGAEFGFALFSPEHLLCFDGINQLESPPDVIENADTYLGNARLKAAAFNSWSGYPALADDTGLEVAALAGRPGVISARYAGLQADAEANIKKLLSELQGVSERTAVFKCVLSLFTENQELLQAGAELVGQIIDQPRGNGGFGYDTVFFLPQYGQTLSELKGAGVKVLTHRVKACRKLFASLHRALSSRNGDYKI